MHPFPNSIIPITIETYAWAAAVLTDDHHPRSFNLATHTDSGGW
jgi:hypothetical protein